jgi:tape measure domain-containing protein
MANLLEYTLSLRDQVTGSLKKIGINNEMMLNSFAKLEKQSNGVSQAFKQMGTSIHTLQQKIDLLKQERDLLPESSLRNIRQYNSEIIKLEKRVTKLQTLNGNPVKKMFGDAMSSLPGLATNPLVLVSAGIGASIKKGMDADMQKANMVTLFRGNEQAAKEMYDKISQYGKISPYEKGDLIEVQKTMMSFGIEANKSFGVMKQIGDIAMGDKNKMQSLSLAFSQATSAGKLQGQDLLQMINAGFNPLQVISERTGQSMASLKQKMEKGGISAGMLAQAYEWAADKQGLFYKGAEKAGQTIGGKASTLMDSLSEMMLSVYSMISPLLMPLIELATSIIDGIGSGINWLITKFKEGNPVILGIAAVLGVLTASILLYNGYLIISKALQAGCTIEVWKTNFAFLANPVFWIIAGIVALIAIIGYVIYAFDGWGAAWGHLMDWLKYSWEFFKSVFLITWLNIKDEFLSGIETLQKAWFNLKSLWDEDGAKAGLAKIANQQHERAKEILEAKKLANEESIKSTEAMLKIFGKDGLHFNGKGLGDVKSDLMKKIGITPEVPGTTADGKPIGDSPTKPTNEAVATGGTKNTTITIHIGKQIEKFTLMTNNVQEGAAKLREIILDEMTRAIAMSQSMAQ